MKQPYQCNDTNIKVPFYPKQIMIPTHKIRANTQMHTTQDKENSPKTHVKKANIEQDGLTLNYKHEKQG